jgi:hypothetical protein
MLTNDGQQFGIDKRFTAEYNEEVYTDILSLTEHPVEHLWLHIILAFIATGIATSAAVIASHRRGYKHNSWRSYAIFPSIGLVFLSIAE